MTTMEKRINVADFNIIPDEVLLKIFSMLPLRDLLLCARQVCDRWYHLSKDETLWREIDLNLLSMSSEYKDRETNTAGIRRLFSDVASSLENVVFSNVAVDEDVYHFYSIGSPIPRRRNKNDKNENKKDHECNLSMKKLRSIDYSYSAVSDANLSRALYSHTQLEELILVHTNTSYYEVLTTAIYLPQLKKFVFHDMHSWDNLLDHRNENRRISNKRATIQLTQNCRKLQWVELYTIWADLDDSIFQSFTKHCPELTGLYLTWSTHITRNAFTNTKACANITHLGLADRQERHPYLNFVVPHFPNLVSLTINGRDIQMEDCVALNRCCPELQVLVLELKAVKDHDCLFEFYLHQHNSLSGDHLQTIVQGCRKLRKVHAPCSRVDDASVWKLALNCPMLEDVNFMHCPLLTASSLKALCDHCTQMKFANFQHTFYPDDYLQEFLHKCPLLEDVNFDVSCTDAIGFNGPPRRLQKHPGKGCGCKSLSLAEADYAFADGLPFIDMESSQECIESCSTHGDISALESDIENVSLNELEDTYYEPVLLPHSHIQSISIKNTNLSDHVLQDIFRFCPDLTHVVIEGCVNITDETVTCLVRCCRHLKVLMMSSKQYKYSSIGDQSLVEISKYSKNLEVLSVLYNCNITPLGVFSIFRCLDLTLRRLRSFSFCVGAMYGCRIPLKPPYGGGYLTKRAQFCMGDGMSSDFRILHLDFTERREL